MKEYERLEMEIIVLNAEDVIIGSGGPTDTEEVE
jgi:hypothetical protein